MERINFNKNVKMHKACFVEGSDAMSGMSSILFKDGYAYATNGYILVKNSLNECSNLPIADIEALNGKRLSASNYANILKYDTIAVSEDGIQAERGDNSVFFYFDNRDLKYPDVEKVLQNAIGEYATSVQQIEIDVDLLVKLKSALSCSSGCKLSFRGEFRPVIFSSLVSSSVGVIMPLIKNMV